MKLRLISVLVGVVVSGLFAVPTQAAGSVTLAQPDKVLTREQPGKKAGWQPPSGAVFNNPYGNAGARFRIERRLLEAIRHTPSWGHIRISIYSFDRVDVAKALVAAKRRGVQVQILLNDHQVTRAQRILHRGLGTNPNKRNFAYECVSSCRGRRDNLHSKFFLFTRTGAASNVVMVGSVNFTLNAVKWQWNDLVTQKGAPVLFQKFVTLFDDMRHDYSRNRPYYTFCAKTRNQTCRANDDRVYVRVFPKNSTPGNDPVLNLLKPVQCTYQTKHGRERTHLRLSMHTMQGDRGIYLARRIRQLWASGCDFKVIYGLMGWHVKKTLGAVTSRGRIPLRSAGFDYDGDGDVNRYTHQKYLTISGKFGGQVTNLSLTGSANWTTRGTSGDEIMFTVQGSGIRRQFDGNWNMMWKSPRYTRNAYTTTSSNYRRYVTTSGVDGVPTTRVVSFTRTVVENRPDGMMAAGHTWESD